jgi:hypothetical protein
VQARRGGTGGIHQRSGFSDAAYGLPVRPAEMRDPVIREEVNMQRARLMAGVSIVLVCAGCGDPGSGHVWKDQTDMIDKSREVETTVLDASRQQRLQIDEMAQ